MDRLLVAAAVLPAFALALLATSALTRRPGARASVAATAPLLYLLVLGVVTLAAAAQTGWSARELGLTAPGLLGLPVALALPPFVLLAASCGLAAYFGELALAAHWPKGSPLRRTGPALEAVTALSRSRHTLAAVGVSTAVLEELLWRGYLLRGLMAVTGAMVAVFVQAIVFGVNHASFGPRDVVAKTLSGALWGALTLLLASVGPAIIAHLTFQGLVLRRLRRPRVLVT